MTKVGILGSGDVGKTLTKGFLKHGYQVAIGSDHAEKLAEFKRDNPEIETASFEQAAQSGELIVLCVKGTVAEKIIEKVKHQVKYSAYIYHNGGVFLGGWLLEALLPD